ncbi:MAG: type IV pilus secretin PilQ [Deltaproteobacteria bacterium HGW-Deltaproteobacteria-19]|nr:MAG: type IV pilus secretin PilQ [Deltaproteobacteria bacterium HGW-Deltaproteobacteria-19]
MFSYRNDRIAEKAPRSLAPGMRSSLFGFAFILLFVFAQTGCSKPLNVKQDPFFDKWQTLSEKSAGSSPTPRAREFNLDELVAKEEARLADEKVRSTAGRHLPTMKVNLKMRQAEVKAVIRSLAKAANRNILVKNDIKGDITVDFHNTPWNQAFESILNTQGLTYVWEGDVIRVMTEADKEQDLKRKTQESDIRRVEPLLNVVVAVDYASPKDLRENLETFLTKEKDGKTYRGSVKVDSHTNSLIIQAIRDDLTKMIPIIKKLDRPTPQILIKAHIVEATKDVARRLGVQWGGGYQNTFGKESYWVTPGGTNTVGTLPTNPTAGGYNPLGTGGAGGDIGSYGLSGQGTGLNFPGSALTNAASSFGALGLMYGTIGGNILELQLNALQTDGKVNILSSPSITTLDNQKAYTESGERVPYETTSTTGGTSSTTVNWEDAVLRLEITPHVIDDIHLKMSINVKKNEVDLTRTTKSGYPFIIKKQTETNLIVRNEETIVISGLSKQRVDNRDTGLPWVKDVPVLGWLVKSDNKSDSMEELLVFVTPKILPQYKTASNGETEKVEAKDSKPVK